MLTRCADGAHVYRDKKIHSLSFMAAGLAAELNSCNRKIKQKTWVKLFWFGMVMLVMDKI